MTARILIFDSGVGGLTVHAEIRNALPAAHITYVADDAAFPYGDLTAQGCSDRVVYVLGRAIERFQPDIAVIACNTASTVALPALRRVFATPFVGTVPAVKPAAAASRTRIISVLGTPGTVSREYTHDLIIAHAPDCRVTLVGASRLARLAEARLKGELVRDADVLTEIEPCFREKDGLRTDAVALACTHYPLLLDVYRRVAPWDVAWIDPSAAIARRVAAVLAETALRHGGSDGEDAAYFTSGASPAPALAAALVARDLTPAEGFGLAFP